MKTLFLPAIIAWGVIGSSTLYSQDTTNIASKEPVDIYDIDLEGLLNMTITVASKKEEKASDAPGMVTSYSSKDIENYGYYNLSDLASITSGYSNFTAFGEKMFETRGIYIPVLLCTTLPAF